MPAFEILTSEKSLKKIKDYYQFLCSHGIDKAGKHFQKQFRAKGIGLEKMDIQTFTGLLIQSKIPRIFAESQTYHDQRDWTLVEESILGDIGVHVPVVFFNDGGHTQFHNHKSPLNAHLLYVPGALLRSDKTGITADMQDVVVDGVFNQERFNALYERRLLPQLFQMDNLAKQAGKMAAITIPGIGTGLFAGNYQSIIKKAFRIALESLLEKYESKLSRIDIIHYDPFSGDVHQSKKIGHFNFRVRPSSTEKTTGQLEYPEGSSPSTHILGSFVAWDHFSWPGNDFWPGSRATDDGVKAASSDSMAIISGIQGVYNPKTGSYEPPKGFQNWQALVEAKKLSFSGNVFVVSELGLKTALLQDESVIVYRAKKGELALKFPSKSHRNRFIFALGGQQYLDANKEQPFFNIYKDNPDTLFLAASTIKGNEITVKFLSSSMRNQFIELLNLPVHTGKAWVSTVNKDLLHFVTKDLDEKGNIMTLALPACCTAEGQWTAKGQLHAFFSQLLNSNQASKTQELVKNTIVETIHSYL